MPTLHLPSTPSHLPMNPFDTLPPPPLYNLPFPGGDIVQGSFATWQFNTEVLGSGSFASVREAVDVSTGLRAVVKSSHFTSASPPAHRLYALRELATLTSLAAVPHPNIVKVYDAAMVDDTFHIVQEKVEGIELFDYLKQNDGHLPLSTVRLITAQLLSALSHVHASGILHRDIKLDNILVDPATLKITLIDFNLSTFFREDTELKEPVGCVNYSSPQVLEAAYGKGYRALGGWSDLWAVGVTVYGMLCGFFPFRSEHARKLYAEHLNLRTTPVQFVPPSVHPIAQQFVRRILNLHSVGRISAISLITDPFVTGVGAGFDDPQTDAEIARILSTTHTYSLIPNPHVHLLASPFHADVTNPDLVVQEQAIKSIIYAMVPGCSSSGKSVERVTSEDTVVGSPTSQMSVRSDGTMGESRHDGCFGLGPDAYYQQRMAEVEMVRMTIQQHAALVVPEQTTLRYPTLQYPSPSTTPTPTPPQTQTQYQQRSRSPKRSLKTAIDSFKEWRRREARSGERGDRGGVKVVT